MDNEEYPLTYGYMQELFGRCLPERGHNVTWLLRSKVTTGRFETRRLGLTDAVLCPIWDSSLLGAKFLDYFYHRPLMTRLLPEIVAARGIDIIFVRNHVRAGALAQRFCASRNIPFVYYLGYPTLESHLLSARRGYRRARILAEVAAAVGIPLRNWVTRKADFVFTMSDFWAREVAERVRIPTDRVQCLPAGFDSSIDRELVDGGKVRNRFNLGNSPTVLYMGTIAPPRDTVILVDILAGIVRHIPEAKLLFLYREGEERRIEMLRQRFLERGLEKSAVFAAPVPYQEVPEYIAAADVGLSPIETIPLYNVSSPYKFTEMLGMGCPVVASDTPEQMYVLTKSQAGICVPYSAEAFVDAVVYIFTHPEEARLMGQRGKAFVDSERSYAVLAQRVEEVFLRLVAERSESPKYARNISSQG